MKANIRFIVTPYNLEKYIRCPEWFFRKGGNFPQEEESGLFSIISHSIKNCYVHEGRREEKLSWSFVRRTTGWIIYKHPTQSLPAGGVADVFSIMSNWYNKMYIDSPVERNPVVSYPTNYYVSRGVVWEDNIDVVMDDGDTLILFRDDRTTDKPLPLLIHARVWAWGKVTNVRPKKIVELLLKPRSLSFRHMKVDPQLINSAGCVLSQIGKGVRYPVDGRHCSICEYERECSF